MTPIFPCPVVYNTHGCEKAKLLDWRVNVVTAEFATSSE